MIILPYFNNFYNYILSVFINNFLFYQEFTFYVSRETWLVFYPLNFCFTANSDLQKKLLDFLPFLKKQGFMRDFDSKKVFHETIFLSPIFLRVFFFVKHFAVLPIFLTTFLYPKNACFWLRNNKKSPIFRLFFTIKSL